MDHRDVGDRVVVALSDLSAAPRDERVTGREAVAQGTWLIGRLGDADAVTTTGQARVVAHPTRPDLTSRVDACVGDAVPEVAVRVHSAEDLAGVAGRVAAGLRRARRLHVQLRAGVCVRGDHARRRAAIRTTFAGPFDALVDAVVHAGAEPVIDLQIEADLTSGTEVRRAGRDVAEREAEAAAVGVDAGRARDAPR